MKQRIDVWLAAHGLAESREKAQALIMAGQVYIGERKVLKASEQAEEDAPVTLRGEQTHFASRGGHKLEKAITAFQADVTGAVALDIGAAAGGFTDVLLRHGAAHVYAIDVGYGQLDWRLRNDARVTVMGRGQVGKNGVVREKEIHARVLREICQFAPSFGWHAAGLTFSPIKGPAGNIEFLADIRPGAGKEISDEEILRLVEQAHRELNHA